MMQVLQQYWWAVLAVVVMGAIVWQKFKRGTSK